MSDADIEAVIARQMPDAEKRRRADVVIRTGLSRHASQKALSRLIREVLAVTRAVLFDTETTGLEPQLGHRVIEVAALELLNDLPTGRHFHALIHPERDIPEDATRIHGFTLADLAGRPRFAEIVDDLLEFFGDAQLIAHNAPFDFAFLDAEFDRIGRPALSATRMIDTLALAKARFPGMPNSLDALCRRFAIDLSARTTHNALLDCRLLADVYVELTGGRQRGLSLAAEKAAVELVGLHARGGPHAAAYGAQRSGTGRARRLCRAAEGSGLAPALRPGGSGDRGGARLGLGAACLPQRDEVDRLQQHRGKPAVARHVRQNVAGEREQDARALDQQDRLDRVVRQAGEGEHAGIGQLRDEHRRRHGRRLAVACRCRRRRLMRLGADHERDLEDALAVLHAAGLDIQVDVHLRLGPSCVYI